MYCGSIRQSEPKHNTMTRASSICQHGHEGGRRTVGTMLSARAGGAHQPRVLETHLRRYSRTVTAEDVTPAFRRNASTTQSGESSGRSQTGLTSFSI